RIPAKILVAECLYEGCIVNKHEDKTYNSVPVLATITVLQKTVCPGNPRHYLVTVDSVTIPVACTCVVPRKMI
uniref:Interleukin-17C n=2 Tax=Oncorhynchus tshawytscha TaxID=74940 RepID=A0AAZ3NWL8_ONCTS